MSVEQARAIIAQAEARGLDTNAALRKADRNADVRRVRAIDDRVHTVEEQIKKASEWGNRDRVYNSRAERWESPQERQARKAEALASVKEKQAELKALNSERDAIMRSYGLPRGNRFAADAVSIAERLAVADLSAQLNTAPRSRSTNSGTRTRAPKAETAASATPKPPRTTLTSARAALRDLTSKVNAADAEVNRAVNSPRDSQDYHRSYTALQSARNERDSFLASLPADLRDKVTTGATATGIARTRTGSSKSAGTTTRTTPAPYETAIGPRAHWHDEQDLRAAANQWAAKMGAKVRSLTFADMPRKWGQMDTNGHMVLSRELLNLPPRLGEYVMAHEAAHALVPNHGTLFGLTLSAYMPDWRERDAELRKLGISETGATRRKTKAAATA